MSFRTKPYNFLENKILIFFFLFIIIPRIPSSDSGVEMEKMNLESNNKVELPHYTPDPDSISQLETAALQLLKLHNHGPYTSPFTLLTAYKQTRITSITNFEVVFTQFQSPVFYNQI